MNWTEPKEPTEGESYYTHIKCETPLGLMSIEWKGWKQDDSYSIMLDGNWISEEYRDLEMAKLNAKQYLISKYYEIGEFLTNEG